MDPDVVEIQELAIKIIKEIYETPTASYVTIVSALVLVLVKTFKALKKDHGSQIMDHVKVDFYTSLSMAMEHEGIVTRKDLN